MLRSHESGHGILFSAIHLEIPLSWGDLICEQRQKRTVLTMLYTVICVATRTCTILLSCQTLVFIVGRFLVIQYRVNAKTKFLGPSVVKMHKTSTLRSTFVQFLTSSRA